MVEAIPLPLIRQEIGFFPAPAEKNGAPAWTLHDPPANKFFLIGWPAFEILSRWHLGSVKDVLDSVNTETTLAITEEDVLGLVAFLDQNFLLEPSTQTSTERFTTAKAASRPGWASWLLNNYLFIRVPLFKPEPFLKRALPFVEFFYSRFFLIIGLIATFSAFYLVSRQWDFFLHSFTAYRSIEGVLTVGCAIFIAKIIHEFGHAFTAHRYGCRIPTMGFALVVLAPMLYTDTNEAWKLTSRSQRVAIGIAGMTAELMLAVASLWAWLLLPAGPLKAATFVLATTTWIMTIALNASPFMRFDGYFILSDFMRLPNLHQRSFAFGRWWLREFLFGLKALPPESVTLRLKTFFVLFAFAVWVYRLVVFFGIALMVYHYFFKALGIFLFLVEIGWFIVHPMYREIAAWSKFKSALRCNMTLFRTLLLLAAIISFLVIPWRGTITAPAALLAIREQQVSAPSASMVLGNTADEMKMVKGGELLLKLYSPDMEHQSRQAARSTEVSKWQVNQQTFDEKLLSQGDILRRRFEAGTTEISGIKDVMNRLTLRAPFDGTVVSRNDELAQGVWIQRREPLYIVADTSMNRVDAYVGEREMERIKVGGKASFIPDAIDFGAYSCKVAEIDKINIPVIDEPFLASIYGGSIASRIDSQGNAIPENPLFRIRMDGCSPAAVPRMKLRGVVHIEAEKRSSIIEMLRSGYAMVIRELW